MAPIFYYKKIICLIIYTVFEIAKLWNLHCYYFSLQWSPHAHFRLQFLSTTV